MLVLGGEGTEPTTSGLDADATVIAADSGLSLARDLGMTVRHVVGDLDSVDPIALEQAVAAGTTVHRHDADKDATDSELAIDLAVELAGSGSEGSGSGPRLTVLGWGGGRLDHLLADLLQLATPRLAAFEVTGRFGPAVVTVVRAGRPCVLAGEIGEQVSLFATDATARGISTGGLRWPLLDAELSMGSTRGVSNEFTARRATVTVGQGTVLAVQPGTQAGAIEARHTRYDPSPRADPRGHTG